MDVCADGAVSAGKTADVLAEEAAAPASWALHCHAVSFQSFLMK